MAPDGATRTYMPSRSDTLYIFAFGFKHLSAASVNISGLLAEKYRHAVFEGQWR
jgi:hypothetical protein